jgi:hypothetical protein
VHATILVTLPGLHLNTAVAGASAATAATHAGGYPYPAYAAVFERVTGARRAPPSPPSPPAVTG